MSLAAKKAVVEGDEIESCLFHERRVRVCGRADDMDAARFHFDDKECVHRNQTATGPDFSAEEVGCGESRAVTS